MQENDNTPDKDPENGAETDRFEDSESQPKETKYKPNFVIVQADAFERVRSHPITLAGGVFGVALGAYAIIRLLRELFAGGRSIEMLERFGVNIIISPAFAQIGEADGLNVRPFIILGIFVTLLLVLLWGLITMLVSRRENIIHTATDLVKTLTGFFIGAATSYLA